MRLAFITSQAKVVKAQLSSNQNRYKRLHTVQVIHFIMAACHGATIGYRKSSFLRAWSGLHAVRPPLSRATAAFSNVPAGTLSPCIMFTSAISPASKVQHNNPKGRHAAHGNQQQQTLSGCTFFPLRPPAAPQGDKRHIHRAPVDTKESASKRTNRY